MQHPMLSVALRAVRKAGNLITRYYERPDIAKIHQKDKNDFLKKINRSAEAIITEIIQKFYPQHSFLSKENYEQHEAIKHDIQWVLNPLDGTTNFVKRLPHFSVSIAVRIRERTEIAVVYDPMRNELFTATRGRGAQLNGYRLRSSTARNLNGTILAIGFPFKEKQYASAYMSILNRLFTECSDFRSTGSTALNLAYVAAGRVDGYFEIALKPWNIIAGELIANEAGALVCDFTGGYNHITTGNLIAGNSHILKAILTNIHSRSINALDGSSQFPH